MSFSRLLVIFSTSRWCFAVHKAQVSLQGHGPEGEPARRPAEPTHTAFESSSSGDTADSPAMESSTTDTSGISAEATSSTTALPLWAVKWALKQAEASDRNFTNETDAISWAMSRSNWSAGHAAAAGDTADSPAMESSTTNTSDNAVAERNAAGIAAVVWHTTNESDNAVAERDAADIPSVVWHTTNASDSENDTLYNASNFSNVQVLQTVAASGDQIAGQAMKKSQTNPAGMTYVPSAWKTDMPMASQAEPETWPDDATTRILSSSKSNAPTPKWALAVHRHTLMAAGFTVILIAVWVGVVLRFIVQIKHQPVDALADSSGEDRLAVLDNAKLILICGVILFHILGSHPAKVYWRLQEARHMQLFVDPWETRTFCFISGVLSPSPPSLRAFKSIVTRLMAPTILYCGCVVPLIVLARGKQAFDFALILTSLSNVYQKTNNTVIWYLQALLIWKLLGFMFMTLRTPLRMGVAIVFGTAAGYFDLTAFHLDRAITYFPIFIFGQIFPLQAALTHTKWNHHSIAVGACILAAVYIFTVVFDDFLASLDVAGWHKRQYVGLREFRLYFWRGLFVNLFETSKGMIFLFMVVPRTENRFTKYGQQSLYAYLLHPFVLYLFERLPFIHHNVPLVLELPFWCFLLAFSFGIAIGMSSEPVRAVFKVFLEPAWLEEILFEPSGRQDSTFKGTQQPDAKESGRRAEESTMWSLAPRLPSWPPIEFRQDFAARSFGEPPSTKCFSKASPDDVARAAPAHLPGTT